MPPPFKLNGCSLSLFSKLLVYCRLQAVQAIYRLAKFNGWYILTTNNPQGQVTLDAYCHWPGSNLGQHRCPACIHKYVLRLVPNLISNNVYNMDLFAVAVNHVSMLPYPCGLTIEKNANNLSKSRYLLYWFESTMNQQQVRSNYLINTSMCFEKNPLYTTNNARQSTFMLIRRTREATTSSVYKI